MDYGKLAYLKAIDLEDRLGLIGNNGFNVYTLKLQDMPLGHLNITDIQGKGDIAVIAFSSDDAAFYADGVKICEGKNALFKLNAPCALSVFSSNGIADLSLMVIGNIVSSEQIASMQADYNDTDLAYMIYGRGNTKAFLINLSSLSTTKIFDEDFVQGDICASGKGFAMALIDNRGVITVIAPNGERRTYNVGADKVAIRADDFAETIAYTSKGKLYYFEAGANRPASVNRIDYNGFIDDVRFVKKGSKLLFSSGGKCYAKDFGKSEGNRDKLYVKLTAEVE